MKCNILIDKNTDTRLTFLNIDCAINHLREEMEADGKTYFMGTTRAHECNGSGDGSMVAKWTRVDEATKTGKTLTRTIHIPLMFAEEVAKRKAEYEQHRAERRAKWDY